MRPLITILLVCFLIGGMYGYLKFADSVKRPDANYQATPEQKVVSAEIQRSAALYADSGFDLVALKVDFKGKTILEEKNTVTADQPISVELPDVEKGLNTISVLANFEDPEKFLSDTPSPSLYAMDVVIRVDGNEVQRQTFTSPTSTTPVGGQVKFDTTSIRQ